RDVLEELTLEGITAHLQDILGQGAVLPISLAAHEERSVPRSTLLRAIRRENLFRDGHLASAPSTWLPSSARKASRRRCIPGSAARKREHRAARGRETRVL